ncbi:MAG: metallopeptidase TldD-related protein [Pseudomonadota bacterium]
MALLLEKNEVDDLLFRSLMWCNADVTLLRVENLAETQISYNSQGVLEHRVIQNTQLTIISRFNDREGVAVANQLDDDSIKRAVKESEMTAKSVMAKKSVQAWPRKIKELSTVETFDAMLKAMTLDDFAQIIRKHQELLRTRYQFIGKWVLRKYQVALQSTQGLSAFHQSTEYDFSINVESRVTGSQGYAARSGFQRDFDNFINEVDTAKRRADLPSRASLPSLKNATVILTPEAWRDLFASILEHFDGEFLSIHHLMGRTPALAGQRFDRRVSIFSQPNQASLPVRSWSFEGNDVRPMTWISEGSVNSLLTHSLQKPREDPEGWPKFNNILMQGMEQSVETLVSRSNRAILIQNIQLIEQVNTRTMQFNGCSLQGTLWIEQGKISQQLPDVRFVESPLAILKKFDSLSQSKRVKSHNNIAMQIPGLRVNNFQLQEFI